MTKWKMEVCTDRLMLQSVYSLTNAETGGKVETKHGVAADGDSGTVETDADTKDVDSGK